MMPKFCANLSTLFTEYDFLDRFEIASDAGFEAVECQFPYAESAQDIQQRLLANDLQLILHNFPAGDWDAGERGIACLPDRVDDFKAGVDQAIEYASLLGCRKLNVLAGLAPESISPEELTQTLLSNLRYAANQLKPYGIDLLIEAINTQDVPGFFVNNTQQVLALIHNLSLQHDNVFMQYDIYHMQIMEGNLTRTISDNLSQIRHIQLADNPFRQEPGTGEINFDFLLQTIDQLGYQGWIGCEYFPKNDTISGLSWMENYSSK